MDGWKIYFAVKINFESQGGGVKYGTAIVAVTQVSLDFAGNLWCEAPLQILTDQPDCSLASHSHKSLPETGPLNTLIHARIKPKGSRARTSRKQYIINGLLIFCP
jgi:hypothetical protein